MTFVNEESHSFTCDPRGNEPSCQALLPNRTASPLLIPVLLRVRGWVGLGGGLHTEVVCPS